MSNLEQDDFLQVKTPNGLNVLTIFTFIGCGLQALTSIVNYVNAAKALAEKDTVLKQFRDPKMPEFAKRLIGSQAEYVTMVEASFRNRLPLLVLSLVACALCVAGTVYMRKLERKGFLIYVAGEILPLVLTLVFIGSFMATSFAFIFSAVVAILFIGLYTIFKKHLYL